MLLAFQSYTLLCLVLICTNASIDAANQWVKFLGIRACFHVLLRFNSVAFANRPDMMMPELPVSTTPMRMLPVAAFAGPYNQSLVWYYMGNRLNEIQYITVFLSASTNFMIYGKIIHCTRGRKHRLPL